MSNYAELEADIKYVKSVINKCVCFFNKVKNKFNKFNKLEKLSEYRLKFIIYQFKNLFNSKIYY